MTEKAPHFGKEVGNPRLYRAVEGVSCGEAVGKGRGRGGGGVSRVDEDGAGGGGDVVDGAGDSTHAHYPVVSCTAPMTIGAAGLASLWVNRTPRASSVRQSTRHLCMRPCGVRRNMNSSGKVSALTPVILAPPLE